jgi:hypothetical protein
VNIKNSIGGCGCRPKGCIASISAAQMVLETSSLISGRYHEKKDPYRHHHL